MYAGGLAVFARMAVCSVQGLLQLLVVAAAPLASQGLLSAPSPHTGLPNGNHDARAAGSNGEQQPTSPEQVNCSAYDSPVLRCGRA